MQEVGFEAATSNHSSSLQLHLLDPSDDANNGVEVIDHAEDNEAIEGISASRMPDNASVAQPLSISADKVAMDAANTDEKDSIEGGLPDAATAVNSKAPITKNVADVPANVVDQVKTALAKLCEECNQSKEVVAHALIITNGVFEDAKNYLLGNLNGSCKYDPVH